jgi:integrase
MACRYGTRKPRTVRQAEVHIAKITDEFGTRRLDSIRPSEVKSWTVKLRAEGLADSYVHAIHARLAQVLSDAVHDGVLTRSPRVSAYVAEGRQAAAVRSLHRARLGPARRDGGAVPRRAAAGRVRRLRLAEACGLRVADIDFMRSIVSPIVQYPAEPLKTEISRTPVPIPENLALTLSAHVAEFSASDWLLTNEAGGQLGPWQLQRAFRAARAQVEGLPAGFRYHDLRHYYASLLIASGSDVKIVQTRLRHASGKVTIDTYGHLWPDSDDSTRAVVDKVLAARAGSPADFLRTRGGGD